MTYEQQTLPSNQLSKMFDFHHVYKTPFLDDYKRKILPLITKKSPPLFLRASDVISAKPLTHGRHEIGIEELMKYAAQCGMNEFLIDIGANIGLSSCLVGQHFKKIFCFEPNPLVYRVLQTNLELSLDANSTFECFPFGFGDEEKTVDINIPKHNFGGAFIKEGNAYSDETLARKDGFEALNSDNYLTKAIKIKKTEAVLAKLLEDNDLKNSSGVIKIDAEGFEMQVLAGIAKVLPQKPCLIVFENHDPTLNKDFLLNIFKQPIKISAITHQRLRGAKIVRYIKSLFGAKASFQLDEVTGNTLPKGDVVVVVGE